MKSSDLLSNITIIVNETKIVDGRGERVAKMSVADTKVLIIEDNVYKAIDVESALKFNGIRNIVHLDNQEEAWKLIYDKNQEKKVDLIVTDMHYPMSYGSVADEKAGLKLIERLKKEEINIPVVVCSSINYKISGILGCIWYSKLRDLEEDFSRVLEKL